MSQAQQDNTASPWVTQLSRRQVVPTIRIIQADLNHLTRPSGESGAPRLLFLERPFMKGPDVRALQERLVALGFEMNPDGEFGPMTDAAVTEFQRQQGFEADGIVGPETRKALKL